ncbi:MAG: hypothetical protein KA205_01375, partial [Acidobacteria bacterium]|nr:hypothetical protein [Acidobacteriota bacterium]
MPTPRPDRIARVTPAATAAPIAATAAPIAATAAPILSGVPKRVTLPRDGRDGAAQPITLTGDHFGPHVSVQLGNMSYVYTYAKTS